jgi:luciferase family oxidoreductase group 1
VKIPLSVLDLAVISPGGSAGQSYAASVALARATEEWGYRRYWLAEHHSIPAIASAATSVLIAHIAARTSRIRVGAGGIMLPNHSPLVIAEQFGTLESLHPGRIDLGLGRAPGGEGAVFAALRRSPAASDRFPEDVLELQALLGPPRENAPVRAIPGEGTQVPLYILGSSLFGARLAARLGLPYAFASHFAPAALTEAVRIYRREFQPSSQCAGPHVIAGLNVFAADSDAEAQRLHQAAIRSLALNLAGRGQGHAASLDEATLLASPLGQQARHMLHYAVTGDPASVRAGVTAFVDHAQANEVIVVSNIGDSAARLRSYELLAKAFELKTAL